MTIFILANKSRSGSEVFWMDRFESGTDNGAFCEYCQKRSGLKHRPFSRVAMVPGDGTPLPFFAD